MKFKSSSWTKTGERTFDIVGELTLKSVTKEVVLKATLLSVDPAPPASQRSRGEASTTRFLRSSLTRIATSIARPLFETLQRRPFFFPATAHTAR